jgi:hypothetical protein
MSDTYLQDFGTRRAVHRSKPKTDPMAASGRWDDLYLRASKPRLRKTHRRDSMRRDIKVIVQKGAKPLSFQPNGEVTTLLGFKCDPSAYKYKLDSPSYPSRSRELSQTDRVETKKPVMIPVAWKDVYGSLREMVRKIRFRDRKLTVGLVRDFQTLWPHRHSLKHAVDLAKSREVFGLPDAGYEKPQPPKPKVIVEVKPRKVAKAIYEEFDRNREMLSSIDHASLHCKDSWHERLIKRLAKVKRRDWESRLDGIRQDLARRQKVLLGIIEAGK